MPFTQLWSTLNLSVPHLTLLTSLDLRLQIKYEIEFFTNRLQHSIIYSLQWTVQALLMVPLMAVQWFGTK